MLHAMHMQLILAIQDNLQMYLELSTFQSLSVQ